MASTPDARPSKPSSRLGLEALGIPPVPGGIYDLALTHRSYAFEQPTSVEHNERLEFLGDSVMGAVVTDLIYTTYPHLAEGEMARLRSSVVNAHALADLARSLGLGAHIRLGKGEEGSGGRDKDSLLADTLEALIGAVYLDRGPEFLAAKLRPLFEPRLAERIEEGGRYDAKTALQEVAVHVGDLPEYRVASSGPDHDKSFSAHVYVAGTLCGVGVGKSKKEAEQNAAREALGRLEPPVATGLEEGGRDARAS